MNTLQLVQTQFLNNAFDQKCHTCSILNDVICLGLLQSFLQTSLTCMSTTLSKTYEIIRSDNIVLPGKVIPTFSFSLCMRDRNNNKRHKWLQGTQQINWLIQIMQPASNGSQGQIPVLLTQKPPPLITVSILNVLLCQNRGQQREETHPKKHSQLMGQVTGVQI